MAAILIVTYHAHMMLHFELLGPTAYSWLGHAGTTALTMFFLISGCLLYRPFALAHFESRPPPRARSFLKRRFVRIFPAYWLALTVAVYVLGTYAIPNALDFVTFYGLVQNYRVGYLKAGLNVSWTLVIEVIFYLLLPLLAWTIRWPSPRNATLKQKLAAQLAGLILVYLLVHALRVWLLWVYDPAPRPYGSWFPWQRFLIYPLSYYDWLSLGMILAVINAWLAVGQRLPRPIEALGRSPATCWLMAIACYWVIVGLDIDLRGATPAQTMTLVFLEGMVALFVVLPATIGPQDQGVVRRILRNPVMAFLGTISYGIYLWHLTFLKQAVDWASAGFISDQRWVQFTLVIALTLACAAISYYALELPLMRWAQSRRAVGDRAAPSS